MALTFGFGEFLPGSMHVAGSLVEAARWAKPQGMCVLLARGLAGQHARRSVRSENDACYSAFARVVCDRKSLIAHRMMRRGLRSAFVMCAQSQPPSSTSHDNANQRDLPVRTLRIRLEPSRDHVILAALEPFYGRGVDGATDRGNEQENMSDSDPGAAAAEAFAREALRIGVLALNVTNVEVSTRALHEEGTRLVRELKDQLNEHTERVDHGVARTLGTYFDPTTGQFERRVRALLDGDDGELVMALRTLVVGENSALSATLRAHTAPLLAVLGGGDTQSANTVQGRIADAVQQQLDAQREAILAQFSLDLPNSALNRFIANLSERQYASAAAHDAQMTRLLSQFSLDDKASGLSRMLAEVSALTAASARENLTLREGVLHELSLDNKASALSLMSGQLDARIAELRRENSAFQSNVRESVQLLLDRAAYAKAQPISTHDGVAFEEAVFRKLERMCMPLGGTWRVESVGSSPGVLPGNKVGDVLLSDTSTPQQRIVVEVKRSKQVRSVVQAAEELDRAMLNRSAAVGMYVWARDSAPPGIDAEMGAVCRLGERGVLVIYELDEQDDLSLRIGLALARALSALEAQRAAAEAAAAEQRANDEGQSHALAARVWSEAQYRQLESAIGKVNEQMKNVSSLERNVVDADKLSRRLSKHVASLRVGLEAALKDLHVALDTVAVNLGMNELSGSDLEEESGSDDDQGDGEKQQKTKATRKRASKK
ncbi:hypothetical protein FVE85_3419 [Porphyridium purpureum]|uniref:Uncharacterized protein n=1 Tax=Porphyridium purpureum TaxID=35688 RepID=A0A5J4YVF2_PORPP|nr:hypothetical protein FVE85_3419 [Porphyridium purpureum]|eukprot:POR5323..scf227_4